MSLSSMTFTHFRSIRAGAGYDEMLTYRRTSLLESPAQTLVNTVNCVGVMGKGLPKEFKLREPNMYDRYKAVCDRGELEPGKLWLWRGENGWVLNFPTKKHWRQPSHLDWVEAVSEKFVVAYEELGIREISFPRLGCGNGNLDWNDVRPIMEHYLNRVNIPVFVHDYAQDIGIPEHLEIMSGQVASAVGNAVDFSTFLNGIRCLSIVGTDEFLDFDGRGRFSAWMDEHSNLSVKDDHGCWTFEPDDLHGAWVALLRGLVTRERVEWAGSGGGHLVISLMSLLPNVRPVEIQRGDEREIAAELKPDARRTGVAGHFREQLRLEWQ